MGHNKIKIQKIENDSNRRVTFNKRRIGLLKKAYEISILCDVDISLIFFSENNELTLFEGPRSSIEEVVMKFANIPADERAQGHTKKYAIVENGSQHTMPKDIEHEELFQEVARQLYQSRQTTNSEDCDRANQMDVCPHAQLQKVKEIRNIQLLLQLYDLNIPISDLITVDNAPELEAYTQRQLQKIQKYKEACLQSSIPLFDIHKNLNDKDDNGCAEQLHESLPGLSDDLSDFLPQNLEGDIIGCALFEEMGAHDKLEKEWEVEILKDLSAGDCQS